MPCFLEIFKVHVVVCSRYLAVFVGLIVDSEVHVIKVLVNFVELQVDGYQGTGPEAHKEALNPFRIKNFLGSSDDAHLRQFV